MPPGGGWIATAGDFVTARWPPGSRLRRRLMGAPFE